MENKDLEPSETPKISEATPLVQEEEQNVETSVKEIMMTKLASELSDLTLEIGDKVTSTIPVEVVTVDPQETAVQVSSNSEGEDRSGASTDVEQSETDVAGETSEPPTEDPQEIIENESPRSSSSDPENGGRNRLFDNTMWMILLHILLLIYPISATYYAMTYAKYCDSGDKLPLLVIIVAFSSFLVLLGRILVNATKKLSLLDENNILPWTLIFSGDLLTAFLFIAEIAYYSTLDTENCEELYKYVNFANKTGMPLVVLSFLYNTKLYKRCFNVLRRWYPCILVACFKI